MTDTPHAPLPPAPLRERLLSLFAVCLAALLLPMSFTAGAIATPAIGAALHGTAAEMRWITSAFMLAFGGCQMAAGTLADTFGRKRLFLCGVALFVLTSLLLGFAQSVQMVDWLRGAQGVAAAATLAGGAAALAQDFDGHARMRAYGLLGTTFGIGLAFGPLLAGVLIDRFGWPGVFIATSAIATLALATGARCMRESRDPAATGLDWPGTLTFTGMLTLFTFGVLQAPASGWSDAWVIVSLAGSVVLLAAFVVVEMKAARPMLDLSLFRYPRFVGVQMLPIATCYCCIVLLVLLPLRFIGIEGEREIDAGIRMLALSVPMLVIPFFATQLTRRLSAGFVSGIGLLIAALGLVWLARSDFDSVSASAWPMIVIGVGVALPWGLMDGLSVSVVPKERAGMATGIFNTVRVAGEGVALAIVGAVLAALTAARLPGVSVASTHAWTAVATDTALDAVNRVVAGDLAGAAAITPGWGAQALRHAYADAFTALLYGLAAMTVLCAWIVLACIGRAPRGVQASSLAQAL